MSLRATLVTLIASSLLLAGCGGRGNLAAPVVGAGVEAASVPGLASATKKLFHEVFAHYDTDGDGVWSAKDFDLPEERFLNLFGPTDTNDDHVVSKAEYYSNTRHDAMVLRCEARAKMSSQGLGRRVTVDNAVFILDSYLKNYLNADDRRAFIAAAFAACDENGDKLLNQAELAHAYAILEAKADEKEIERQVNRSKGQPEKPINDKGKGKKD